MDRVRYTKEEWDKLADIIFSMRKNNPASALATLAKKAMSQMTPDRRRELTVQTLGPIIDRLKERYRDLDQLAAKAESLDEALTDIRSRSLTRQDVIKSFTDDELVSLFGQRVLRRMADQMGEPVVEAPGSYTVSVTHKPTPPAAKVGVLGFKNESQRAIVQAQLGDGYDVRTLHPESASLCDLYVVWTRFVSHADSAKIRDMSGNDLVYHHGGLETMAQLIREELDDSV